MEEKKGEYQVCGPTAFNFYGFDDQLPRDLGSGIWGPDLGSSHAKSLKSWGKSYKDSRFLVLNIPFWVQNNSFKDFYKIVLA